RSPSLVAEVGDGDADQGIDAGSQIQRESADQHGDKAEKPSPACKDILECARTRGSRGSSIGTGGGLRRRRRRGSLERSEVDRRAYRGWSEALEVVASLIVDRDSQALPGLGLEIGSSGEWHRDGDEAGEYRQLVAAGELKLDFFGLGVLGSAGGDGRRRVHPDLGWDELFVERMVRIDVPSGHYGCRDDQIAGGAGGKRAIELERRDLHDLVGFRKREGGTGKRDRGGEEEKERERGYRSMACGIGPAD